METIDGTYRCGFIKVKALLSFHMMYAFWHWMVNSFSFFYVVCSTWKNKFKWYLDPLAECEGGLNRSNQDFQPELLTLGESMKAKTMRGIGIEDARWLSCLLNAGLAKVVFMLKERKERQQRQRCSQAQKTGLVSSPSKDKQKKAEKHRKAAPSILVQHHRLLNRIRFVLPLQEILVPLPTLP